jgi:hypothetical protein
MYLDMSPYWFTQEGIDKIERDYNAKYMGYWCTKHSSGWWNNHPVDVFYQENPDTEKGHTKYFGMFISEGKIYITKADSSFGEPITGVLCEDGEVLVSRYRNHYIAKDNNMIDGGRDYLKYSVRSKMVQVSVIGNEFKFDEVPRHDINTIR